MSEETEVISLDAAERLAQENIELMETLQRMGAPMPDLARYVNLRIDALLDLVYPPDTPLGQMIAFGTEQRMNALLNAIKENVGGPKLLVPTPA